MTVRAQKSRDIEKLKALAARSGFPYPEVDDPHIEAAQTVVDSTGKIIVSCVAKRLVELYLYVDPDQSPAVKLDALKLLHRSMAAELCKLGYDSAESFLPPQIEKRFGRRLQRTFGWVRNWASFCIKF